MSGRIHSKVIAVLALGVFAGCFGTDGNSKDDETESVASGGATQGGLNCAKTPQTGGPQGTAMHSPTASFPAGSLVGSAAQISRNETYHDLKLILGAYQNVCDYAAVGLGKKGASDLAITLRVPAGEAFTAKTYQANGIDISKVIIFPVVNPGGALCDGPGFTMLGEGTVTIESITDTRVKASFDLKQFPGMPNLTGSVDAPICNGPKESCGCAP